MTHEKDGCEVCEVGAKVIAEHNARSMTPKQVLTKTADLIEEKGKATGAYWSSEGFCVVGGVRYVLTGSAYTPPPADLQMGIYAAVFDVLREAGVMHGELVTDWSDNSTKEEVVAGLRAAAATQAV